MKIIILDDHKIFGESLRNLLLESDTISLCDFVSDVGDFLKKSKKRPMISVFLI